jgi:hypothetical protein
MTKYYYKKCNECRKKKMIKYYCKYCEYSLCNNCLIDEYEIFNNTCILCFEKHFYIF